MATGTALDTGAWEPGRTGGHEAVVDDDDDTTRRPLSSDRVLAAAVELADRVGVEPLTIRRLADELGVGPMTIYHHVANKEAILDGMVDRVFAEMVLPPVELPWRDALRRRCVVAREVLATHPWAVPLMESRTSPGPATLEHHDAVLRCLRRGGLSWPVVAHAYAIVDAFLYGFAVQEASLPGTTGDDDLGAMAQELANSLPSDRYPDLAAFTVEHVLRPGYDFGDSFLVGLDLLLDGIERLASR